MLPTKRALTFLSIIVLLLIACGGTSEHGGLSEGVVAERGPVVIETVPRPGLPAGQPVATAVSTAIPPPDNFFRDYGVNPFVDTAVDHLSTFALDVDTGAYSVARRYIQDGLVPPAEAVRVEEFVNYFDQGYALPPDTAFAIYADGAPSPFHFDGSYLLRIGIQGYAVPEEQRQPANLAFVIDVSGSMARENRLELLKGA